MAKARRGIFKRTAANPPSPSRRSRGRLPTRFELSKAQYSYRMLLEQNDEYAIQKRHSKVLHESGLDAVADRESCNQLAGRTRAGELIEVRIPSGSIGSELTGLLHHFQGHDRVEVAPKV